MSRGRQIFIVLLFSLLVSHLWAKETSLSVSYNLDESNKSSSQDQMLTLIGLRLALTNEYDEQKLNTALFWEKMKAKNFSVADEVNYIKSFFSNTNIILASPPDPKSMVDASKVMGSFVASFQEEKLKELYVNVVDNIDDLKKKNFYIQASIEIDKNLKWDDLGVSRADLFIEPIIENWKKLISNNFKGFELVTFIDKDFVMKPEVVNPQSVTLKWKSLFKKVSPIEEQKKMSFALWAQFILVNTRTNEILTSFDFPVQKREYALSDKKALSSGLASLVYNLLLSQEPKIAAEVEASQNNLISQLEVKMNSRLGLSEAYQIKNSLQEAFKDIKLTAEIKTYLSDGATFVLRARTSEQTLMESLSKNQGKLDLNEQKVLVFNSVDKTFAIILKEKNN